MLVVWCLITNCLEVCSGIKLSHFLSSPQFLRQPATIICSYCHNVTTTTLSLYSWLGFPRYQCPVAHIFVCNNHRPKRKLTADRAAIHQWSLECFGGAQNLWKKHMREKGDWLLYGIAMWLQDNVLDLVDTKEWFSTNVVESSIKVLFLLRATLKVSLGKGSQWGRPSCYEKTTWPEM